MNIGLKLELYMLIPDHSMGFPAFIPPIMWPIWYPWHMTLKIGQRLEIYMLIPDYSMGIPAFLQYICIPIRDQLGRSQPGKKIPSYMATIMAFISQMLLFIQMLPFIFSKHALKNTPKVSCNSWCQCPKIFSTACPLRIWDRWSLATFQSLHHGTCSLAILRWTIDTAGRMCRFNATPLYFTGDGTSVNQHQWSNSREPCMSMIQSSISNISTNFNIHCTLFLTSILATLPDRGPSLMKAAPCTWWVH